MVKKHVNACTRIACHLMPEEPIAFLSITPSKILIDLGGIEVKVGALDPRNVITRQRARPGIEQRQLVGSLQHRTKATGVVFTVGMLRENVGLPRLEALRFLVGLCNGWTAGIAHFRVRLVPVFVLLSAVPVCVEFIVFIMMRCARCTGTRHSVCFECLFFKVTEPNCHLVSSYYCICTVSQNVRCFFFS